MTATTVRLACALAMCAAACGDDDSDYETQTNPPFASLVVSQIIGIQNSVAAGSPDATSAGVQQLGAVAQNVITPKIYTQQLRLGPRVAPLIGNCSCDAAGCQFDGCGADDGSWTIDGSIEVSGDTYSFDVEVMQHFASENTTSDTDVMTSGEVTINAAAIDGHIAGEVDALLTSSDPDGITEVTASIDWDLGAVEIALDASRCPVAGSLEASISAKAWSGGGDADYSGSGTVVFGPACGDAAVAR